MMQNKGKRLFLKKVLIYGLGKILYPFHSLFSSRKDIWLVGSWFGESYGESSRYFYEYLLHKGHLVYWVTRNRELFDYLKAEGKPVLYAYDFSSLWYILLAKVYIMSHNYSDIHYKEWIHKRGLKVELWHGIPLKKIGLDANQPLLNHFHYDLFIASSLEVQKRMASAFGVEEEKVLITGYPRTDPLFCSEPLEKKREKKVIFYLPTHREQGRSQDREYIPNEVIIKRLNHLAMKYHFVLKMKFHFHDISAFSFDMSPYEGIELIKCTTIFSMQEALLETDLLITDYSSVYFDYLPLKRAVLFSAFDREVYEKENQGLYEPLEEIAIGAICSDWEVLIEEIIAFFEAPTVIDTQKWKSVMERFYDIQDCQSSQRLYDEIIKRCGDD